MRFGLPRTGIRTSINNLMAHVAARRVNALWTGGIRKQADHGLKVRLIVSLTSYPPRFSTLSLTLKTLLSQSVKPDAVVLWIAEKDIEALPPEVRELASQGVLIEPCEDLRSYKKIIPAITRYPDAAIVIADDDVYYPRDWLSTIVSGWNGDRRQAVCRRAHLVTLNAEGEPEPYVRWTQNISAQDGSPLVFATGMGGVLYPPGMFGSEVLNMDSAMRLCPNGDDIWLYWMALRVGAVFKKIGGPCDYITWPDSQSFSLMQVNVPQGGNDLQIAAMVREFGFPPRTSA